MSDETKLPDVELTQNEPDVEIVEPNEVETAAPDPGVDKLKGDLAAAKAREEANRQRAEAAERQAAELARSSQANQFQLLQAELDAAVSEHDAAGDAVQLALESGDYAAVKEANKNLSLLAAKIDRLQQTKGYMEAQAKTKQPTTPVDAFMAQFSPQTQAFIRANPQIVEHDGHGSLRLSSAALAAHYTLVDEGVKPETPEYYEALAQHIASPMSAASTVVEAGADPDEQPVVAIEPKPEPRPRPAPTAAQRRSVAAPVSRGANPSAPGRPGQIRLTSEQVEAARIAGISPTEYANNLNALKAEGKIGRQTH